MAKVLIFESSNHGHRLDYIVYLVEASIERGFDVTVCCPLGDGKLVQRLDDQSIEVERLRLIDHKALEVNYASYVHRYFSIWKIVRKYRPDRICVPTADGLEYAHLLFSCFGCALRPFLVFGLLRLRFGSGGLRDSIRHAALQSIKNGRIIHFDEFNFDELREKYSHISLAYDPIDILSFSKSSANPDERPLVSELLSYILVLGYIDRRKGLLELVKALHCESQGLSIVVAGVVEPSYKNEVLAALEASSCKVDVVWLSEHLTDLEFHRLIQQARMVWVGYKKHSGPSGILLHAAAYGKCVIGNQDGWIGRMIEKYGIGYSCEANDPVAVADAITLANQNPRSLIQASRDELIKRHSYGNFTAQFFS